MKIENLGVTALGHEDVRWLDVPVNDASFVRGIKCIRNLDGKVYRLSMDRGLPVMRCFSVCPSMNSIAMNSRSPSSAIS
jgi:hypothetical protein